MKITVKYFLVAFAALMMINMTVAGQYRNHATLSSDMNKLARANTAICEIKSLVKTAGDVTFMSLPSGLVINIRNPE
ncbi:MAG: hypothetical protein IH591_08435 [Bacteroidales bacterium]|nr:hypothetical protein [Bacteroidales bacterium]